MVGELDAAKLTAVIDEQRLDLAGVAEHWRGKGDRVRKELGVKATEERKRVVEGLVGESMQWVERCRTRGVRGGGGAGD